MSTTPTDTTQEVPNITSYNEWMVYIHDWAERKGWWKEERNSNEMIALMHSELSEALEAWRHNLPPIYFDNGKPEGVIIELVDCQIRILDTLGKCFPLIDLDTKMKRYDDHRYLQPVEAAHFGAWLATVHYQLDYATRLQYASALTSWWTRNNSFRGTLAVTFMQIHRYLRTSTTESNHELIRMKMAYNEKRPYRHGDLRA